MQVPSPESYPHRHRLLPGQPVRNVRQMNPLVAGLEEWAEHGSVEQQQPYREQHRDLLVSGGHEEQRRGTEVVPHAVLLLRVAAAGQARGLHHHARRSERQQQQRSA